MKPNLYPYAGLLILLVFQLCATTTGFSQNCRELTATYSTFESRCTATGAIGITASGGSGTYNYKVQGPTNSDFTSSSLITGLPSGTYTVTVKDIVSNCSLQLDNVIVGGTYQTPRFGITETDVTCLNGNDGAISVVGLQNGLSPFMYSLVAPSQMGVGTTSSTGTFTGLTPGSYSVQMTDSCGAIQTRNISIQNYNWSINSTSVTLNTCTQYNGQIILKDTKGNSNTSGSVFNGYQYGVSKAPGDTVWFGSYSFAFDLAQARKISLLAKDRCGNVKTATWTNSVKPSVTSSVSISAQTCTGFTATLRGQQNLTTPKFCLVDAAGNPVPGQPCNNNGNFVNIPYGSYCINLTNSCYDTVITRCFTQAQTIPAITGAVSISNYTCTDVTATLNGQNNLQNPQYCLFNSSGAAVGACNTTGIFKNVPYGAYTLKMTDGCSGAVLPISFTATRKLRAVDADVTISGNTCTTFNATVTGTTNFPNPQYCLVDHLGNIFSCNNTGIFPNLPYGSYCINVKDLTCTDTTIQRCFSVPVPVPAGGAPVVSDKTCSGFTITVTGQSILNNGQYCLQDQAGNSIPGIPCNTTGVFTNIPYGSYCVKTTDGCSGTVFTNCLTVTAPAPSVGPAVISNVTCAGFTATVSNQQNLSSPSFCLFDAGNNQVGACNGTGVFSLTTFGSYTIKTTDGCTNAHFQTSFSQLKSIPSEAASAKITNQNCTTFSVAVTNQVNLTNAHYYLKDNTGTVVMDNLTGVFDNVPNGPYCLETKTACMDTTLTRCFTGTPGPTQITLKATPSCTYDSTDLTIKVTTGFSPYTVNVFDASGNLLRTATSSSATIAVTGLPALASAQQYKVTVTGNCGLPATQYITPTPSNVSHVYTITPKCPSSIAQTGSADLNIIATSNLSGVTMSITQKNFAPVSIGYSFNTGNSFTFSNLEAATYVITYAFSGCTTLIRDTVKLPDYVFPSLGKSAAYQCDNNSFSIGAAVTGGMSPFTYQVIGSSPAAPSINSATQSNPVFTINNGVQYSLIRLRAVDACGNAALNDVSILPLANTIVTATSNCIRTNTTLSTDVIPNATYTWYKKIKSTSTDSTLVGTGPSYAIPQIAVSDTGIYVNKMSVNNGCLTKLSYFHLDGVCPIVLAGSIQLKGTTLTDGSNQLSWAAPTDAGIREFVLERSDKADGIFTGTGVMPADQFHASTPYVFTDKTPSKNVYFYRLLIRLNNNTAGYSNVVVLSAQAGNLISVYPNPVDKLLNISIRGDQNQDFSVSLYTTTGQVLYKILRPAIQNGTILYQRDPGIRPGLYFIKVDNLTTGESNVFKIIFK
ncbi:T9SS type A sorting domain-containing protein [Flavitalea flava]